MAELEGELFGAEHDDQQQDPQQEEQQLLLQHQQQDLSPAAEHLRLSEGQQQLVAEQWRLKSEGELLQQQGLSLQQEELLLQQQHGVEQQALEHQQQPEGGEERRSKKSKKGDKKHKHKHKHKHKRKQQEQRSSKETGEDADTLGGFIERDPEAAIHEDPEDIVPVEGGIDSEREPDWTDPAQPAEGAPLEGPLSRSRRKRRARPLDSDLQLFCNQMLQKMSEAAQQDERSMELGEPATAKLQMLDSVCSELVKPKWRHWFVAEGCCQVIAGWLAPFKDDSLPNFSLRRRLLEVLGQLPISAQDLVSNDLGKVLVVLWQHEDETESNRQLIRGLIQRWMRPVLGLGSSHRQLLSERERAFEANDADLQQKLVKAAQAARQRSEKAEEERAREQAAERQRRTARVPFNKGHNFLIQPRSQVDVDEADVKHQPNSQFPKALRIGSRAPRRPTKAAKVSIEGRGL